MCDIPADAFICVIGKSNEKSGILVPRLVSQAQELAERGYFKTEMKSRIQFVENKIWSFCICDSGGPVIMPPIDHGPWLLGQGDIALAEWLSAHGCYPGVWGFEAHPGPMRLATHRSNGSALFKYLHEFS